MGSRFQTASEQGAQVRTILVDDSEMALRNISGFLRSLDRVAVVGTATSGAGAIELSQQVQPDLVLLDVQMPGMTGFEACQKLLASYPAIRVVMISVHSGDHVRDACLAIGAHRFITKTRLSTDLPPLIDELFRGGHGSPRLQ